MSKERAYHSDPEILGGTLVFKGTRVPVQSLFDHLKAGDSIEVFLDGFPSVKRAQVLAVLRKWKRKSSPTPDVRILLDENLNWRLEQFLPGHEVKSVPRLGWAGLKNGKLLARAAQENFDVLITMDGSMASQQNLVQN